MSPYALSAGESGIGLAVDTDISLEGDTARHWLLSGEMNLEVRDNEKALIASWSWDEITSVRTVTCVGCGLLQVRVKEEWRDVLRFFEAATGVPNDVPSRSLVAAGTKPLGCSSYSH